MVGPYSWLTAALKGEKMRERLKATLLACLAVLWMVHSASAQVNTADILGTVSDAGGAGLANAEVPVQETGTKHIKKTTTNGGGDYCFKPLQTWEDTISVGMPA